MKGEYEAVYKCAACGKGTAMSDTQVEKVLADGVFPDKTPCPCGKYPWGASFTMKTSAGASKWVGALRDLQ